MSEPWVTLAAIGIVIALAVSIPAAIFCYHFCKALQLSDEEIEARQRRW